jgi:hypothetical protein
MMRRMWLAILFAVGVGAIGGRASADTCSNGIQDPGELGIDCGGVCPAICENGVQFILAAQSRSCLPCANSKSACQAMLNSGSCSALTGTPRQVPPRVSRSRPFAIIFFKECSAPVALADRMAPRPATADPFMTRASPQVARRFEERGGGRARDDRPSRNRTTLQRQQFGRRPRQQSSAVPE